MGTLFGMRNGRGVLRHRPDHRAPPVPRQRVVGTRLLWRPLEFRHLVVDGGGLAEELVEGCGAWP